MKVEPMEQQDQRVERSQCDVLVIGGGGRRVDGGAAAGGKGLPGAAAGEGAASALSHRRVAAGSRLPLFERLGGADEVTAVGMEKWAAELVSPYHDRTQVFHFAEA